MKIQQSQELEKLSQIAKTSCTDLSCKIIEYLTASGFLEACSSSFGSCVKDHYSKQKIKSFELMFRCTGIRSKNWRTLRLSDNLVIIGDGDCPSCGGELVATETGEFRIIEKETAFTPSDIEIQKVDICLDCGESFNLRYE